MKTLYTIGFSGKDARTFFTTLKQNNISLLVDIRLNNVSQLAGYTKKNDLEFFLREICNIDYSHEISFAPTKEILDNYKNKVITWEQYKEEYISLMEYRKILNNNSLNLDKACLLCSEKTHEQCHRSLLANIFIKNEIIDNVVHI